MDTVWPRIPCAGLRWFWAATLRERLTLTDSGNRAPVASGSDF
jgi:hypothetical protein